ncbi:hypothetical protein CHS0354_024644 [Potamilus streckersoni]|uniref:Rhodanese domain-containing protein n=1 Tax=Potamilus streckersoni TaxID=2493646 RepID=A0AAE0SVI5_9BIVA|nr:hypothetical protein CHS0354_024644 [Potamilus streckersoni]
MAADYPLLVSSDWLKQQQVAGVENIVVIDASWSSAKNCQAEYEQAHIPGAVYINVMDGENNDYFPRNIPNSDKFEEKLQQAGINHDSHVVIYSSSDNAGFLISGRAWWTFKLYGVDKVSILDGGLEQWKKNGYELKSDIPTSKKGNMKVKRIDNLYRTFEDVQQNLKSSNFQVCDTRPATKFSGPESDGHIPGAKNLPMAKLVDMEKGTLLPVSQLKKLFLEAGLDLSKPVVVHCMMGMSSCTVAFAAILCGSKNVSVYHGGATEWGKKASPDQIQKYTP